jgi:hypothetical protein
MRLQTLATPPWIRVMVVIVTGLISTLSYSSPANATPTQLAQPFAPIISQASPTSILVSYTRDPLDLTSTITLYDETQSLPTIVLGSLGPSTITGLNTGDSYHATITSIGDGTNYSSSLESANSNVVLLTIPQLAQPTAPTIIQTSTTSITVTFAIDHLATSTTVSLYDATAGGPPVPVSDTTGTHTFTGLITGHTYHATITSIGDGVNYLNSLEGSISSNVVPTFSPLGAPTITSTTPGMTSVAVHFDAVANAATYTATVFVDATPLSTNSSCTPTICVIQGLAEGISYTVQVEAIGDHVTHGDSASSLPSAFLTGVGGGCGTTFVTTPAPPPAGVAPSSLGSPSSCSAGSASTTTVQLNSPNTSSTYIVPIGALPGGTIFSAYPITNITTLAALVPSGHSYVVAVAFAWRAPDGTSPTAISPITLTVADASIAIGDIIYRVTATGVAAVDTAVSNGTVTITFTSDPIFVVTVIAKSAQAMLIVNEGSAKAGKLMTLSTSGGSGTGAVTYKVIDGTATGCTIGSASPFRIRAANSGSCLVTATKAADANYGAISSNEATLTFTSIAQKRLKVTSTKGRAGSNMVLTTTGGSGSGRVRFKVLNGTSHGCSLSVGRRTTLRAKSHGTCLVTATKRGDTIFRSITSMTTTVNFVRGVVPGPKVTTMIGVVKSGGTSRLIITGSGFGATPSVASTGGGVSLTVVSSNATKIVLTIRVKTSVALGRYQLTVTNRNGTTSANYHVNSSRPKVNVSALVAELFAGYRQAWATSPTAGITYAFRHDYPGSATSLSAFLSCSQKVDAGQTGETDTPQLSTLQPDPAWRGIGPNTVTWSFTGKKPNGTTYSVIDVETTTFSGGSTQNYQKSIHVTILNRKAYFYLTPAC